MYKIRRLKQYRIEIVKLKSNGVCQINHLFQEKKIKHIGFKVRVFQSKKELLINIMVNKIQQSFCNNIINKLH